VETVKQTGVKKMTTSQYRFDQYDCETEDRDYQIMLARTLCRTKPYYASPLAVQRLVKALGGDCYLPDIYSRAFYSKKGSIAYNVEDGEAATLNYVNLFNH
jgi:hypothetical protein